MQRRENFVLWGHCRWSQLSARAYGVNHDCDAGDMGELGGYVSRETARREHFNLSLLFKLLARNRWSSVPI